MSVTASVSNIRQLIRESARVRTLAYVLGVSWCVSAAAIAFVQPLYLFVYVLATLVVVLCALHPEIAVIMIALIFPFTEFQIVFGELNAPIVDMIGTVALFALGIRLLCLIVIEPHRWHTLRLPALWPFVALMVAAGGSVYNSWEPAMSVKYLLRVLIFFYLVYVFLLVNTITTRELLMRIVRVVYFVGIVVAAYGFAGFFVVGAPTFLQRRAVPFGILGVYPLGTNHNLIADMMISTIPLGFFLLSQTKHTVQKRMIFLGALFMLGVALLTFSRAAWLALIVELCVLLGLYYRSRVKDMWRWLVGALLLALPFIVYMGFFATQDIVESSNQNRRILGDIAVEMFREYPIFGAGAGTFVSYVEENRVYAKEFGAPLDAHGFVLKVSSEMGIVGLVAFSALLLNILWILWSAYARATDPFFVVLCVSMLMMAAGSMFFQLFQTSYFVSKLWFPLGIALAAAYQSGYHRLRHVHTP